MDSGVWDHIPQHVHHIIIIIAHTCRLSVFSCNVATVKVYTSTSSVQKPTSANYTCARKEALPVTVIDRSKHTHTPGCMHMHQHTCMFRHPHTHTHTHTPTHMAVHPHARLHFFRVATTRKCSSSTSALQLPSGKVMPRPRCTPQPCRHLPSKSCTGRGAYLCTSRVVEALFTCHQLRRQIYALTLLCLHCRQLPAAQVGAIVDIPGSPKPTFVLGGSHVDVESDGKPTFHPRDIGKELALLFGSELGVDPLTWQYELCILCCQAQVIANKVRATCLQPAIDLFVKVTC